MVSGDSDWTAFSRHFMRNAGAFEGIANSNGLESKTTQVAAYCSSVSISLVTHRAVSTAYLIEA